MSETNITYQLSDDFKEYLAFTNRTIKDFYCRKCGKLMIDFETVDKFKINRHKYKKLTMRIEPHNHGWDTNIEFPQTKNNMYLFLPKTFTKDCKLFRHTCWECYLKESWYKPYKYTKGWKNDIPSIGKIREDFSLIFDISTEEIRVITKQNYATNSLERFIKKYGEIEGPIKYDEYKKRQAYTASTEYFINEKGMTKEQAKQYHKMRGHTLQSDIEKYGEEEGTKKWNEYCKRQAYAGVTLEYFIEKYGEEFGTRKYQEVLDKKLFGQVSPISLTLFDQIKSPDSLYGVGKEYILYSQIKKNKRYLYDFCDPTTKKIIEFNGVDWHAKPTKYKENDLINFQGHSPRIAKDIWAYDAEKIQCANSQGYRVLVIWEDDYKNDPKAIVEQCKQFLYNDSKPTNEIDEL